VSLANVMERAAAAGLRPPTALTVAITGACNLRCKHCWIDAGTPTSAGHVDPAPLLQLVDDFVALGVEALWITGGEPLAHPELAAILSHCCAAPSVRTVGLQTNAGRLDRARVAALRALPGEKLRVAVSLDGASARAHDRVRGPGSHAATLAGAARLVEAGLGGRTTLAFTEMRHNIDEAPLLLDLAEHLGVSGVVAGTLVCAGRAVRSPLEPPTPEQYRAQVSRYGEDLQFRERYERLATFPAIEWWKGRFVARGEPCTFMDHPYVASGGTLHPCRMCHAEAFAVERVFERPLEAALEEAIPKWVELRSLARSRPRDAPECRACAAAFQCGGGCVGRVLASGAGLGAPEDRCALRKAVHAVPARHGSRERERVVRPAADGHPPAMDMHELLAEDRALIILDAWRSVVKLTHYERDGKEVTRERVEALFDYVARAILERDLGELLDHSERIAKQRFDAGFDLCEVQNAFFMLEDAIVRRSLARLPPGELAEALGLVGTVIRRGKDAFARAYISLTNRARAPSLDLSDRFKGT
jgi:radical SAM protein with 4Fe4S-binding SPASM domain